MCTLNFEPSFHFLAACAESTCNGSQTWPETKQHSATGWDGFAVKVCIHYPRIMEFAPGWHHQPSLTKLVDFGIIPLGEDWGWMAPNLTLHDRQQLEPGFRSTKAYRAKRCSPLELALLVDAQERKVKWTARCFCVHCLRHRREAVRLPKSCSSSNYKTVWRIWKLSSLDLGRYTLGFTDRKDGLPDCCFGTPEEPSGAKFDACQFHSNTSILRHGLCSEVSHSSKRDVRAQNW